MRFFLNFTQILWIYGMRNQIRYSVINLVHIFSNKYKCHDALKIPCLRIIVMGRNGKFNFQFSMWLYSTINCIKAGIIKWQREEQPISIFSSNKCHRHKEKDLIYQRKLQLINCSSPSRYLMIKYHYNDIIMRFNCLFMFKENIKALRHWSLWGEFTGDRWIPHKKGL